ncbi:MAG: putative ABC exporter domain-containing protein [Opitutus sp.]|nr:putative ABC exporter domain-containing protein [Opitutus sp.]
MLSAVVYLRLNSLRNLVWSRVRRLREPKYLIGAVVGVSYFYFVLFRQTGLANGGANGLSELSNTAAATALGIGSLMLATVMVFMWVMPSGNPGLTFTEAEIAFLFPAPVTRRSLIHYKLLSTQLRTLVQSLFFTVVFNHRSFADGRAAQVILGWWLVLSVVNLHYMAASLTISRLAEGGVSATRRRFAVSFIIATLFAGALAWIWRELPPGPVEVDQVPGWIATVTSTGALGWLLWPFRALIEPFFARGATELALACLPAALVLALHYRWVVGSNVAFEEASLARAEKRAAKANALQRTGALHVGEEPRAARREPFSLARVSLPELAFLWKNLLSTSRPWFTGRNWLAAAGALIVVSIILMRVLGDRYWVAGGTIAAISTMIGGAAIVYGPLLTRLDLRQDLVNADLLKTYPLPGWRIVLGEILTPVVVLTGAVWLGLLGWWLGLHGHQPPALSETWFSPGMRIVLVICGAFLAPWLIALELLVPNAAPILLPGWFQTIRTPGAGIDLMGQRLIFGFGQIFVVLLALLPAGGGAALVMFIINALVGPAAATIAGTVVASVVLIAELWCGLWLVGSRFERFDVSSEPRP